MPDQEGVVPDPREGWASSALVTFSGPKGGSMQVSLYAQNVGGTNAFDSDRGLVDKHIYMSYAMIFHDQQCLYDGTRSAEDILKGVARALAAGDTGLKLMRLVHLGLVTVLYDIGQWPQNEITFEGLVRSWSLVVVSIKLAQGCRPCSPIFVLIKLAIR